MKNTVVNQVKKAASIVLCRSSQNIGSMYDYQILMLERKGSLSSFGSVLAFPGGKVDYQTDEHLAKLGGLQSNIMATVLRECFQETGLYLTEKPIVQTSKICNLNQIKLNFIASEFYKKSMIPQISEKVYQKNPNQQIQICNYLKQLIEALPPKKSLLPFIRLVTVPLLKQRFDAFFYVHKLEEFKFINFMKYAENQKYIHSTDKIITNDESASFDWYTPTSIIKAFIDKKVKLAPPQFIMLNIMLNFHKFKELQEFLKQCSHKQINMGPNIVSMINNTGSSKQNYPYAATLLGDFQFPYDFCMKNQKNSYLIEEINCFKQKNLNNEEKYRNRLLFKKPLQFFEDDFSSQCNISGSVMTKFLNSNKLKKELELYQ